MLKKTCETCKWWFLYVHPNDKRQHATVCKRFPPQIIMITSIEPSPILGQQPQMRQNPAPINPATGRDDFCGEWLEREGELRAYEIPSPQKKPDPVGMNYMEGCDDPSSWKRQEGDKREKVK